ncbi:DUF6622 family protein [Acidovorax sp. sic0104]|uniref:DUF6622 family protein n=1 Tax=Acidovorax sp. sic0104 TaxID=2854784 RepID=UPI001C4889BF|nr:DUF6622 family protein [Acidovorax sp. sic0104]MBV7544473.1 hypothetical protein [Acidovorax sp. sic0104]
MLLQLLVHQPQALGQIIQQTPYWVWGLLAALVWLGASQMFDRTASLVRVVVMPVAMTGFSVYGLATAFGGAGHTGSATAAWMAAAAAAAVLALWFQPTAPAGTLYDSTSRCFRLPGSAMPLALIMGIFLTKYLVGVELAMQPALARDSGFALQIAALYGLFNGLFAARSLRLWRLVRNSAGFATEPASA